MERSEKAAYAIGVFGLGGLLISLAGPDFIPNGARPYLGYGGLAIMIFAIGYIAILHVPAFRSLSREKMIALAGMIFFGIGFVGCTIYYFWPKELTTAVTSSTFPSPRLPVASTKPIPAPVISPPILGKIPTYTKTEWTTIIDNLGNMRDALDQHFNQGVTAAKAAFESCRNRINWNVKGESESATHVLNTLKRYHGLLQDGWRIMDEIGRRRFAADIYQTVADEKNAESSVMIATSDLISSLQAIAALDVQVPAQLSRNECQKFGHAIALLETWMDDSRARIADKTKEIRALAP